MLLLLWFVIGGLHHSGTISTVTADRCDSFEFSCANGRCIPDIWRCNGFTDCTDGSDETSCPNHSPQGNCTEDEFLCNTSRVCITKHWFCDGDKDCDDGSDEPVGCSPPQKSCPDDGFLCAAEGNCLPSKWKCDSTIDCSDGSDEKDCQFPTDCILVRGHFRCYSGLRCLNGTSVCNGKLDCDDGSDEGANCSQADCKTAGCEHGCFVIPEGRTQCFCRPGFELQEDGRTCTDVDECEAWGTCSQTCTNVPGSFRCSCQAGYFLKDDNRGCSARGPDPVLLFSFQSEVHGLWLRTDRMEQIAVGDGDVYGVAFDGLDSKVYWTYSYRNRGGVSRKSLYGSLGVEQIVTSGMLIADDIDFDWISRNIYFVDSELKHIAACSLEGMCVVLVDKQMDKPRAIKLDPVRSRMIWTDWGRHARIDSAGMDGSGRSTLVSDGLVWPNGLAIDFATSRIFWSDAKLDKIESVRFDGSDRKVLPHVLPRHPFSLAVFEDSVFWSDWELDAIHSCNKFTGKNTTIVLKESDKTYLGISVYHPVLQQNANNPCSGSRCSDVCLLSPTTGHVCRCGKGRTMTSNSKDCVEEQTHSYMVISQQQSLLAYYMENFGKDYIQRLHTSPLLFVGAIAYTGNNEILVSDNQRHRIFSYNLATRRETTLVQHHLGNVVAVTWDAMRGNMFWADSGRRMVEVWTNRSGTSYRRELATDILHLLDLTCYSLRGWLFYSTTLGIFRLNMDGTGLRKLINDVTKPTSVAVDADLERLFWCDSEIGSLGSIRLDGTDRQAFKHYLYHPYSVTLTEFHVFWTDLHTRDLHWADKLNPDSTHRKAIEMPSNLTDPIMKVVYVDRRARLMRNASQCERMHCSQLCLVTEGSKEVCQCRTGMRATAGGSCAPEECHDDQFTCNDGACIASEWRCDGEYDCTDGEDELCPTGLRRACTADEFKCSSGECVIGRCNGDKDCADGSDEEGCAELQCDPVSQFRCAVGPRFCLPLNYRCDNVPDCTDSSDEMNCDGNCTDEQFRCTNGLCIQKSWECDGRKDCVDGSDEHSECVGAGVCTSRQFKCENGYCVDVQMLCDGNDDCTDGSDETQCPGPSPDPRVDAQTACGNELFWCHLTMEEEVCVPLKGRCNGTVECPGEEDELDCPCVDNTAHFHCRYINRCISRLWLCDGENDCGDNSDERGCSDPAPTREPVSCRKGQYQCDSGECVDVSLLCNDISDCADHSDETGQCDVACRPETCAGSCQPTPTGPLCNCSEGLVLGEDGRTCLDVDECQDVGQCSQWCHNTFGSFKCSCDQGYRLEANGRSCRATGVPAQLLYTSSGKITMMSVRDGTLQLIKRIGKSHVQAVDYNLATGHVYWSDEGRGSVKRVETSDGSTDVVLRGLEEPDVIAHDWITGNVYVAENGRKNNTIKVCANFKKCRTLFNDSVSEFSDIALVPQAGAMVWCTHSLNPGKVPGRVERWTMDGSHGKVLVNTKILSCRGLAVDFVFKRIYWSDPFLQTIKSVDWDGKSIQGLPIQQLELPTSLTLLEDQIYFVSGIARNEIKSCNKFTGQNCSFLMFTQDPISDVIALQDSRQPRGTDPCPLKKCKEVCALKPGGATCLASDPASTKQSVLVIPGEHPYKLCPSNKCKNGGTCVQENGNLKCLCPPGLAGVVCERDSRKDPKEKFPSESQTTADADGPGSNSGVTVALVFVFVILPLGIGITWFVCKRLKGHHVGRFASIVHFRNPSFGLPHQEVLAEPSVDLELNNNAKKTNSHTNPGYEDHRPPAWQIGGLNLSPSSSSFDSAFVSTQGSQQKPSLLHENSDEDVCGTNAFGPVNFHERLIIQ